MRVKGCAQAAAGIVAWAAAVPAAAWAASEPPAGTAAASPPSAGAQDARVEALSREVEDLRALVQDLQAQVKRLSAGAPIAATVPGGAPTAGPLSGGSASPLPGAVSGGSPAVAQAQATPPSEPAPAASGADGGLASVLRGVTINGELDTYYEYNTNNPVGRANLLRAYDVTSNNFSLNQADLVLESAPDPAAGKRFGLRIDLQYGQATATLQGAAANEPRPDIYQNIFEAYGTYVLPVARGLTVDFGKWASSLGYEGNYTKDQINYSRSFLFDFLPFYHAGVRAKLQVNDILAANLWVANGAQQTESFNNYKDQLFGLVLTPTADASLTLNYYHGQEHPDVVYTTTPPGGVTTGPNLQGYYIEPISGPATGRLNIFDAYGSWQATPKLLLAAEADYVEERDFQTSPRQIDYGAAAWLAYQITPHLTAGLRGEYLSDRGALFSGVSQALAEGTITMSWRPADGFQLMGEYRIDGSTRPYFLGSRLGELRAEQPTIGLGAIWWFGQKSGAW